MFNIDNTLEAFINADFKVAKLMHQLRRLAIREYNLQNYGECSKRCISWMKIYSIILSSYVKYADIFTTHKLNTKPLNNPDFRLNYIINQLRDTKYKNALYWYTQCSKFLVGPNAYCLIEKINKILPKHEQYEAFLTYSDIVEADKGLHNTYDHYLYMLETKLILNKAKKYNERISSDKILNVLNSIHIKPRFVEKPYISQCKQINQIRTPVNNTTQTIEIPLNGEVHIKNIVGMRLTNNNAKVGMIISYETKKGTEFAKIIEVCKKYVDTIRLKKDTTGNYVAHNVAICKVSQNKPEYTRVISILKK